MKIPTRIKNLEKRLNKKTIYLVTEKVFNFDFVQTVFIELIQNRLKNKGTDKNGAKLRTNTAFLENENFYSLYTQSIKNIPNSQHVTLHDSGDFYKSMDISVSKTFIQLTADFEKKEGNIFNNFNNLYKSENDFENAILGLNNSDMNIFLNKVFLPYFNKNLLYELLK